MTSRHEIFVFLRARLDRASWLGLGLTVSAIVAMGAIWAFASLLDAVLDNATMVRLDMAAATWMHIIVSPIVTSLMEWISRIGSPGTMTAIAVLGGLEMLRRRRRRFLVIWTAAFAGAAILERTLKALVHRHRPVYAAHRLAANASFPSGHATLSFVGCAMLVYALIVLGVVPARRRGPLILAAATFVILVGASRVYLDAHFPSDVLGGWSLAAAWVATCIGLSESWRLRVEHADQRTARAQSIYNEASPR